MATAWNRYYTFEICLKKLIKCQTTKKFRETREWAAAQRNNWLNRLYKKSKTYPTKKINGYYSFNVCKTIAKKCKSRTEFKEKFDSAYQASLKNGWMNKICNHMEALGNRKYGYIYAFENLDGTAYVGKSYNPEERRRAHLKKHKGLINRKRGQKFKIVSSLLHIDRLGGMERLWMKNYRKMGWILLNIVEGGSMGGSHERITKKVAAIDAKKCKTKSEFAKKYESSYRKSLKMGWLSEITSHMTVLWQLRSDENLLMAAKKYKTRAELNKNDASAVVLIDRRNLRESAYAHFDRP